MGIKEQRRVAPIDSALQRHALSLHRAMPESERRCAVKIVDGVAFEWMSRRDPEGQPCDERFLGSTAEPMS